MKELLNLQSSFSSIYTSWKDKTPIISTETVRMVTNISTPFLQIQSIFIASKEKQMIFVLRRPWSSEKKLLISKGLAKLSPRTQKLYQITYIFCNPLWPFFIQPFDTSLLASRRTIGLQWIWRAQLCIQKIRLHCSLPCNYVTSLLAYCRG